jgi:serine protease Do
LQVFRRGGTRDLALTVVELEPEQQPRRQAQNDNKPPAGATTALGLTVSDLTDAQKKELKIKGGVRIDAVDGSAARSGLREGDVILSVANTDVVDVKQFETVLAKLDKSRPVNVLYRRGEWAQYALIRPTR